MPTPRNILIFRYGQLGDTLAALPALWALREFYPHARLTLLGEQPGPGHVDPANILPRSGLIDDYWKFPTAKSGRGLADIAKLALRIRRARFDRLAYLAPGLREQPNRLLRDRFFLQVLSGLRPCIGFREMEQLPPKTAGGPLPHVKSEAECLLGRLANDGIVPPGGKPPRTDLSFEEGETRKAEAWWSARGLEKSRCVALGTGAKWPSKAWPLPHFEEAGRRLIHELGLTPVIFGGPEDRPSGQSLCQAWGRGLVAAGELSVREAAAVMRGMAFYLGNDTGTMHLAAAAGLRCVGLFAAQDWPGRWHPIGAGHQALRVSIDCEGCLLEVCPRSNECLRRITPAEALRACQSIVGLKSGGNVPADGKAPQTLFTA